MSQSDSIKNLAEALAKAQAKLKNPHFDATNPHFKSKFASLGAVRAEVIPAFCAEGLSLSQWPVSEDGKAGCRTLLAHSSGEWMEGSFLIPVDKHNAHGYASAVTYAKRISMQSVAGVVGEQDDDGNAAVGENVEGKKPASGSAAGFNRECFDALPLRHQEHITGLAMSAIALLAEERVTDAYLFLEEQKLDDQEKPALWSLLDSKQRSAIKKAGEDFRAKKPQRGATPAERAAA